MFRWIPKQVLDVNVPSVQAKRTTLDRMPLEKKRPVFQQRRAVPSVSWRRKPTFPDPFLAQQQAITLQKSTDQKSVTPRMSASASDLCRPNPSRWLYRMTLLLKGNRQFQKRSGCNQKKKDRADTPSLGSSKGTLQAPQSSLTAVRRVVAPTLSAAIVYNSTPIESSSQRSPLSKGKYAASSDQSMERQIDAATSSLPTRSKSVGKYGPKSSESASRTVSLSRTSQSASVSSGRALNPEGSFSIERHRGVFSPKTRNIYSNRQK